MAELIPTTTLPTDLLDELIDAAVELADSQEEGFRFESPLNHLLEKIHTFRKDTK